jgi:hypothetical protein
MALNLSALNTDRPLPEGAYLILIFVRGWTDTRAVVRLEGFGQLKNPLIRAIELGTLKQPRYRMNTQ